jgi:hypothetical protein
MIDIITAIAAATMLVFALLLLPARRRVATGYYSPTLAWLRGGIFFCACFLISRASGVMTMLLYEPWFEVPQLGNLAWWVATLLVSGHVAFAYLYFWPRGTSDHGRPLHRSHVLTFGVLWGLAQSQLVLSVYVQLSKHIGNPVLLVIAMVIIYSAFAATWQSRYWDVHVSPAHNIREWNVRKVLIVHLPFLILSLIHLGIFENAALFVMWQVVALAASTWVMHFPAPGDPETPQHDGQGVTLTELG